MILLFLDLQGTLFHFPLELKITVNSIQSQKHWAYVSPLPVLRPGSVQVENFSDKWGIEPPTMAMNPACQVQWKANQSLPQGLLHWGCYTLSFVHDSPVTETCVKQGSNRGQGPMCFLLLYQGSSSPFRHCATSAGKNWHISRIHNRTLARLYSELDLFKR
jgi:hypothetical protein